MQFLEEKNQASYLNIRLTDYPERHVPPLFWTSLCH